VAGAVAAALALAGCTSQTPAVSTETSPTGASATAASPTDASSTAGSTAPSTPEHTGQLPPPPPAPTDDAPSQDAALALGAKAVTAFARPDLGPDTWWAELSPLLSPAAALAYEGTDPVEVPARRVTGPAWAGVSPSSFLATVFVPTDAGDYAVLMVREGGGAPWLVERITLVPAGYVAPPAEETGP
jgi:hypothetical protein